MGNNKGFVTRVSLIVALGGFLMGFDASVISGVNEFIEIQFQLSKIELGWAVGCLTLTATLAMILSGRLSDKYGRKTVLKWAAVLYAVSAILSAIAPSFILLIIARMIGGLGVGASLIVAPMYIAEISPAKIRGRMVSFNQLNIVIGISVAFFTNYLILQLAKSDGAFVQALRFDDYTWRWMLGIETFPAILYFIFLYFVPPSPRWLALKGEEDKALEVLTKANGKEGAVEVMKAIKESMRDSVRKEKVPIRELFNPALKLVLLIGIVIAVLQQITGINAVFFYAPMIFKQTGIGTDASFSQAILVGITNLVFTILAMWMIDKVGRKFLLVIGFSGIFISMAVLAYSFFAASYSVDGTVTQINSWLVLGGILGFVASFAISVGPVMWVLFSELFPNRIRGLAISFVGFINSAISFGVQLVFPWELEFFGSATTFAIYGVFGLLGLVFVLIYLPETKGKSLEELEKILVKTDK